jgi:hypothetical protein
MMQPEAISLVTSWLAGVDFDAAESRIAEKVAAWSRWRDSDVGFGAQADPDTMIRTSVHESGHAIVANQLGRTVLRVSIRQDGAAGFVQYGDSESSLSGSINAIVSGLAGIFSELALCTDPDFERRYTLKNSYDVTVACTQIRRLQAQVPDWNLSESTFAQLAYSSVRANWKSILTAAALLRTCGELDGATIAALCGPPQ